MLVVIPTLGMVAGRYGVSQGDAQFLIATYIFGLGLGQPMVGALSDRYGRRPIILAGFTLFTLASIGCALVTSFPALIFARLLQALGVSVGTVGSRAIVRDTHDALGAVRALSWIGAAMGIAPVVGPLLGGILAGWSGPQSVFLASAALGVLVTVAMYRRLTETRVPRLRTADSQSWIASYRELLGSRIFVGYTLMYAFMQGCFLAFLAVGAAVFEEHLGIGAAGFGAIWGAMGIIYVLGAMAGARLGSGPGMLRFSTLMALASGLSLVGAVLAWGVKLTGLLGPLTLLMFASGIQTPRSVAGAVNCRPDIAGTAAGLSSSLALVLSGSFSVVSGYLYAGDFLPIAVLIALSALLTGGAYWMTR